MRALIAALREGTMAAAAGAGLPMPFAAISRSGDVLRWKKRRPHMRVTRDGKCYDRRTGKEIPCEP